MDELRVLIDTMPPAKDTGGQEGGAFRPEKKKFAEVGAGVGVEDDELVGA